MSDASQIRFVHDRLRKLRARSKEHTDAESKSLRTYSTRAHTLITNRLDILDGKFGRCHPEWASTTSYWISSPWSNLKDNTFSNHIFQPLFDQEEPEFRKPIYVKMSTTTKAKEGGSVFEACRTKLMNLGEIHGLPTIEMLARQELGDTVVDDLFQRDFRKSSLFIHVKSFLATHGNTFPAGMPLAISNRLISPDLVMKSKYYASRDDNRAYCADQNLLRALSGACLQKLFLPQSMHMRRKLSISKYVPAVKKDMLDLRLQLPPEGYVLLLLLGDVSNFTGSAANAWLMLVSMATELSVGGLQNKLPNLFALKDTFFTATWFQVISLYLYLTVGYPCFVESRKSYAYMPGGFLGVNGNITIALVWLSVLLRYLSVNPADGVKWTKSQAGGDDFAIVVMVEASKAENVRPWVEGEIINGVGNIKELKVFQIDNQGEGVLEDAIFCRKRIKILRTDRNIILRSEPAVPLPESLAMDNFPSQLSRQVKLWNELDAALLEYDRQEPQNQHLTSVLRTLLMDRCPSVQPIRVRKEIPFPYYWQILAVGPYQCSLRALDIANEIGIISAPAGVYLTELPDQIRHALVTEKLEMVKVIQDSEFLQIVLTRGEARKIRSTAVSAVSHVGLVYDNRLRNLLKS